MAIHITTQDLGNQGTVSVKNLRSAFEKSVGEIHRADIAASRSRQAPIVSRARVLGLSSADAEKRALSAAARALAQLWKV